MHYRISKRWDIFNLTVPRSVNKISIQILPKTTAQSQQSRFISPTFLVLVLKSEIFGPVKFNQNFVKTDRSPIELPLLSPPIFPVCGLRSLPWEGKFRHLYSPGGNLIVSESVTPEGSEGRDPVRRIGVPCLGGTAVATGRQTTFVEPSFFPWQEIYERGGRADVSGRPREFTRRTRVVNSAPRRFRADYATPLRPCTRELWPGHACPSAMWIKRRKAARLITVINLAEFVRLIAEALSRDSRQFRDAWNPKIDNSTYSLELS